MTARMTTKRRMISIGRRIGKRPAETKKRRSKSIGRKTGEKGLLKFTWTKRNYVDEIPLSGTPLPSTRTPGTARMTAITGPPALTGKIAVIVGTNPTVGTREVGTASTRTTGARTRTVITKRRYERWPFNFESVTLVMIVLTLFSFYLKAYYGRVGASSRAPRHSSRERDSYRSR